MMIELTGRCKEDFDKYIFQRDDVDLCQFGIICESMRYGVYIDFFNTVRYRDKELFSELFKKYYNQKTEDFTHHSIVRNTIEACNEWYNTIIENYFK